MKVEKLDEKDFSLLLRIMSSDDGLLPNKEGVATVNKAEKQVDDLITRTEDLLVKLEAMK